MEEIWKNIKGYEDRYQASNFGRFKSLYYEYFSGKENYIKKINPEYIMKETINVCGYKRIGLTKNGIQRIFASHRLIAKTFIPNPENKPTINHKNGIKTDNRVVNLEWATMKENNLHAYKVLGKKPTYGRRKISDEVVKMIRNELINGIDGVTLSKKYNLSTALISLIKNNKIWKDIII